MNRIFSVCIIVATAVIAFIRMLDNNDIVLHWNMQGDVDWKGSHYAIIALPLVSLLLYLVFQYYDKHPEKYNYSFKVVNKEAVYSIWKRGNSWVCMDVTALLLYITLCASGYVDMQPAIVWGLIILDLLIMVLCSTKSIKANKQQDTITKKQ